MVVQPSTFLAGGCKKRAWLLVAGAQIGNYRLCQKNDIITGCARKMIDLQVVVELIVYRLQMEDKK